MNTTYTEPEAASKLLVLFREHEKSDRFFHKMFIAISVFLVFEVAIGAKYIISQQQEIRVNQTKINHQQSILMSQLQQGEKVSNLFVP